MVYHALLELGVPEIALSRSPYRAVIIKNIKAKAQELIKSSQMKNALKLFINNSIDYDEKAQKNAKEDLKDSKKVESENVLTESLAADFWSTFDSLIRYLAKTPEDAQKVLDDPKVTQLRRRSAGSLNAAMTAQIKTRMLAFRDSLVESMQPNDSYFASGLRLNEGATPDEIVDLIAKMLNLADPTGGADAVMKTAHWNQFFNGARPTLSQKFAGPARAKLNSLKLVLNAVKEEVEAPKLTEQKVEWTFEMNDDDLYVISGGSIKVTLNDEEIEKLVKGVSNKDTVIVRDDEDPSHKVAFSPRGHSVMVKKVGTSEGTMMKPKEVEMLLDFISGDEEEEEKKDEKKDEKEADNGKMKA
jgi:hypothetical protein